MKRRRFLQQAALAAVAAPTLAAMPRKFTEDAHGGGDERVADLVIIGGGLGGCAAALAALRGGLRVVLAEETEWLGGQLTSQAVPPDENRWIESIGGTASYRALREGIRDHYRARGTLTREAAANARLNPGNGWVSRLCCEPRAALAVLESQLAPFVQQGTLYILRQHRATAAEVDGDRVRAVVLREFGSGNRVVVRAPVFVDATELGDLLPLTGTEYVTGAEAQRDTGEPHAPAEAQPDNVQAFTVCFAMDFRPGEDHRIDRPTEYDAWRSVVLEQFNGPPTRLLSFDDADSRRIGFDPVARSGFWSYRRIIDRALFAPGTFASDITIVNWAQNDYSFGSLIDVRPDEAARHLASAKALSLSLLYWLQTEAPRPDGGAGWPGLRLRPDVVGTRDGLAMHPYIRESRRIRAQFTVCEQHITREARLRAGGGAAQPHAEQFADSVGIGHYSMDLHRTTRGDRGRYGETLPFQIPLGALLPQRVENLLPAAKNLGVTHLTNGCYRLHPVEWNVGEAAGALAAFCARRRVAAAQVHSNPALLADFQRTLVDQGVRLSWPADVLQPTQTPAAPPKGGTAGV